MIAMNLLPRHKNEYLAVLLACTATVAWLIQYFNT